MRGGLANKPSINEEITKGGYDMSLGDSNIKGVEKVDAFGKVSLQAVWDTRTQGGGSPSTVALEQSNDGINWDDMGLSLVLGGAAGSDTVEDTDFSGGFVRAVFTQGNTLTGNLKIHLNAK